MASRPSRRHRADHYAPRAHDARTRPPRRDIGPWGSPFDEPERPDAPSLQDVTSDELLRLDAEAFGDV